MSGRLEPEIKTYSNAFYLDLNLPLRLHPSDISN